MIIEERTIPTPEECAALITNDNQSKKPSGSGQTPNQARRTRFGGYAACLRSRCGRLGASLSLGSLSVLRVL